MLGRACAIAYLRLVETLEKASDLGFAPKVGRSHAIGPDLVLEWLIVSKVVTWKV
jgi:hypothetical protein